MKKFLKLCFKIGLVLVILAAGALVALRLMFPPEKLKAMALEYAKNNLQREISFDKVSFNLIGVTLNNFALSENTTFQNGTFVRADKLVVKVALMPLLKKRVEISTVSLDGLDVNLQKNKDGSFNFDTLLPQDSAPAADQAPAAQTDSAAFVLLADRISATDCDISYVDQQTGMKASVNDLNVEIRHLDLQNPFDVKITFNTRYQEKKGPAVLVPVTVAMRVFLADLDLAKAYVTVNDISAAYKTVKLQLKGGVKNFTAPQAELSGSLTGINNKIFADFLPDLPNFSLPAIQLSLKASADLENSTAVLSLAKLAVEDSAFSANGTLGWGGVTPTYKLAARLKANIAQLVQMTDAVDEFKPAGEISGALQATDKKDFQDVSGTLTLKNVSALYEPFTLEQVNGTVKIASLEDISCPNLTGLLNREKFAASFSYKNIQDVLNLVLNAKLDKLTLKAFPASSSAQTASGETSAQSAAQTPELKMNVKAQVEVGEINVPYFRAEGFNLAANLTGVSESMKTANGQVSFTLKPGAITDLDQLVQGNKIVKILLLPITLVRRVAGMLNIDLFPAEASAKKGEITYTGAEGLYTFVNGVMQVDKTTFNSKLTDINGSGNIDFNTQALDMKVSATVLTSQTPVVIKIGGTLDNPKGKLDVLNTVGSLVGGILNYKTPGKVASGTVNAAGSVATGAVKTTGKVAGSALQTGADVTKGTVNVATDTVKGTVGVAKDALKGLGGLFKKKETTPAEETK